jgi:glycogen operon protein
MDWSNLEQHQEIYRFTQGMIAFRRAHPVLSKEQFYIDTDINWFGSEGGLPNWTDTKERRFACLIHEDEQHVLCLMFNAGANAVDFRFPPMGPGTQWYLAVDTSGETPKDLFEPGKEPLWRNAKTYHLSPRSSAILLARGMHAAKQKPAPASTEPDHPTEREEIEAWENEGDPN